MKRNPLLIAALAAAFAVGAGTALAQTQNEAQTKAQAQTQTQARERIYGSDLMTPQERNEYVRRMRELKTQEEREQFRKEHHEKMQARAKERGITLPDEPPAQGRGMGPRYGDAPGMGTGPRPGPGGGGKGR